MLCGGVPAGACVGGFFKAERRTSTIQGKAFLCPYYAKRVMNMAIQPVDSDKAVSFNRQHVNIIVNRCD